MVASSRLPILTTSARWGALLLRRSALFLCLCLAPASAVFLLSTLTASEGEKAPLPPSEAPPSIQDLEVTIRAREALGKDEVLAPLSLGVKVRNGVLIAWGPIPSLEITRRATKVLENVRGVYEVRLELFVAAQQLVPVVLPLHEPPRRSESASPDRDAGQITSLTGRQPEAPRTHVTLHGPVSADDPPSKKEIPAVKKSESQAVEPLPQAVERLRLSDLRYQSIKTEIRNGTVFVRGGVVRGEYVTSFAQELAKQPGVERVVVEQPSAKP